MLDTSAKSIGKCFHQWATAGCRCGRHTPGSRCWSAPVPRGTARRRPPRYRLRPPRVRGRRSPRRRSGLLDQRVAALRLGDAVRAGGQGSEHHRGDSDQGSAAHGLSPVKPASVPLPPPTARTSRGRAPLGCAPRTHARHRAGIQSLLPSSARPIRTSTPAGDGGRGVRTPLETPRSAASLRPGGVRVCPTGNGKGACARCLSGF